MDTKEKLKNYFETEADKIEIEFKQSSSTEHSVDTGSNRENILKTFLNNHLPGKFEARKGGKIFDSIGNISKQVDMVIYDNSIPRLGSKDKTLFLAEGVSTAIEVKSVLNKTKLNEALENLKSIKKFEITNKIFADFIFINNKAFFLRNNGSWTTKSSQGEIEKIKNKYLVFYEDKMILYRLLMTLCKEIDAVKLGTMDYTQYINLKFE